MLFFKNLMAALFLNVSVKRFSEPVIAKVVPANGAIHKGIGK